MHPGRTRDVLCETILRRLVGDANTIIAESRVFPGQEVSGKLLVEKPTLHQQLYHATPENLVSDFTGTYDRL